MEDRRNKTRYKIKISFQQRVIEVYKRKLIKRKQEAELFQKKEAA